MNQYQNLIFSICLKLTGDYFIAEDLTQETFISAYHHLDKTRPGEEKAWLCRIASNKSIDYVRKVERKVEPVTEEELHNIAMPRSVGMGFCVERLCMCTLFVGHQIVRGHRSLLDEHCLLLYLVAESD